MWKSTRKSWCCGAKAVSASWIVLWARRAWALVATAPARSHSNASAHSDARVSRNRIVIVRHRWDDQMVRHWIDNYTALATMSLWSLRLASAVYRKLRQHQRQIRLMASEWTMHTFAWSHSSHRDLLHCLVRANYLIVFFFHKIYSYRESKSRTHITYTRHSFYCSFHFIFIMLVSLLLILLVDVRSVCLISLKYDILLLKIFNEQEYHSHIEVLYNSV